MKSMILQCDSVRGIEYRATDRMNATFWLPSFEKYRQKCRQKEKCLAKMNVKAIQTKFGETTKSWFRKFGETIKNPSLRNCAA
jgi:hypothetical protein